MEIMSSVLIMFMIIVTTTRPQTFDIVVAQDGSGNFTQISQAVAAAPNNSPQKFYIKIKAGMYNERIQVGYEKQNLAFLGDGMDTTVITSNRSVIAGFHVNDAATLDILGDGFIAVGISIINSAGPNSGPAVALRITSKFSAFYQCRFDGYQDTLYVGSGTQFYRNCEIYGTVDFIFGNAAAVFQNCDIYVRNPPLGESCVVTAQGKDNNTQNTGISLHNCTITVDNNIKPAAGTKVFLGRPWRSLSTVVVMQSFLDNIIDPQGWLQWGNNTSDLDTLYYGEYQNRGPGAGTNQRVKWKGFRVMNISEAETYTVRNFIQGETWINSTNIPVLMDLI